MASSIATRVDGFEQMIKIKSNRISIIVKDRLTAASGWPFN